MADEPVVVLKSQPMKLGNNVEGKTETTANEFSGVIADKICNSMRRGEAMNKSNQDDLVMSIGNTNELLAARVFSSVLVVTYWLASKTVHRSRGMEVVIALASMP